MEFDDHDEQEEEVSEPLPAPASCDALGNSARLKKHASRYRECLKNHAVSIGGHAVDGCGEYMPAGQEGTLDSLKCAACGCHRNFHRKESDGGAEVGFLLHHHHPHHHHFSSPYYRPPAAGYVHMAAPHIRASPALALPLSSGGGAALSHEEQEDDVSNPSSGGGGTGKKRFRTRFTAEQKEKMLAFAERLGWRIQKHDEAAVQQFCTEACLKRHVLKVWMHNNKHTLGKKPQ